MNLEVVVDSLMKTLTQYTVAVKKANPILPTQYPAKHQLLEASGMKSIAELRSCLYSPYRHLFGHCGNRMLDLDGPLA